EAQQRLDQTAARSRLLAEQRALSAAGAGGTFVPTGFPAYLGDLFAFAARDRAVLAGLLPNQPLPEVGMDSKAPRLTTGASVGIGAEGAAVSSTDPGDALASSPVSTISGFVELSQQL